MAYNMVQRYIAPRAQGYEDVRSRSVRDLAGTMGQVSAPDAGGLNYGRREGTGGGVRGIADALGQAGGRIYGDATPGVDSRAMAMSPTLPTARGSAAMVPARNPAPEGLPNFREWGYGSIMPPAGHPAAPGATLGRVQAPAATVPMMQTPGIRQAIPTTPALARNYTAPSTLPPGQMPYNPDAWYRPNDPSRPGDMTNAEAAARGYPVP